MPLTSLIPHIWDSKLTNVSPCSLAALLPGTRGISEGENVDFWLCRAGVAYPISLSAGKKF